MFPFVVFVLELTNRCRLLLGSASLVLNDQLICLAKKGLTQQLMAGTLLSLSTGSFSVKVVAAGALERVESVQIAMFFAL